MREYSRVGPKFWLGKTGKELRKAGAEAQVVAMYLMTSPHANMLGLYWVPTMYIAHETGLGMEGASKGLQRAIEAGFCEYDEASEVVWVYEMARFQIADSLVATDKRCIGIQNEYNSLPANPFLARFFAKYSVAFNMAKQRGNTSPIEAPSEGLGSQAQAQAQEQAQEHIPNPDGLGVASEAGNDSHAGTKHVNCPHQEIIEAYHELLPASPRMRDWTPARQAQLRARWNEDRDRQNIDYWRRLFAYVAESRFLTGRTSSNGREPFHASLDWIVKSENFAKIREGRYHKEAA